MKRFWMALLALALLLGGAQAQEDIFAITPTPTAAVGSIGLSISEYTYAVLTNDTLGVRFSYPSHWIQTPGRRTISYEEPVAEGDIPARMAVSVKQLDDRAATSSPTYPSWAKPLIPPSTVATRATR